MAIYIDTPETDYISLDQFVRFIESEVQTFDEESMRATAPMLRKLANNPALVLDTLNAQMAQGSLKDKAFSAQTITLASREHFYVRANIWPSTAEISRSKLYQDQFAYDIAHDHNYWFSTAVHHGPGYETEIFEYDYSELTGIPGQKLELRHQETRRFGTGSVMIYVPNRDVHIQRAPDELTITINLMTNSRIDEVTGVIRDQFFFDVDQQIMTSYPPHVQSSERIAFIEHCAAFPSPGVIKNLHKISLSHGCRRTRWAAFKALAKLLPDQRETLFMSAKGDSSEYVARQARSALG